MPFTSDVAALLRQMHLPRKDVGLVRYVTESIQNVTSTLTFGHGSHLLEGLHARADLRFCPDILQKYGLRQPFGLPSAADGLTVTLAAHLTHWGADVHVSPPTRATPLPTPGIPLPAI